MERTISEAEKILKDLDKKTFKNRVERLAELGTLHFNLSDNNILKTQRSVRTTDYISEAAKNYVIGCYISCIFCCSSAVEQTFKNEMLYSKTDIIERKTLQKKLEDKTCTFGKLIKPAKNYPSLKNFIDDAYWLNKLRNQIAVHPIYISHGNSSIEHPEMEWRKESIVEYVKKLMEFFDEDDKEKWREMLNDPKTLDAFFEWGIYTPSGDDPLKMLALKAYKKMGNVLESLYNK